MFSLRLLNRDFLPFCVGVMALVLALNSALPATASAYRGESQAFSTMDTWNNVHSFLMFDYRIAKPASIAKRYDAALSAELYTVAALRSGNPNIFITYYLPFHRDYGTFMNYHAIKSLKQWKASHPDWILYKCDRVTPAYEYNNPNMPLDFSNPAVVSWQVQNYAIPASQFGYDGITMDNFNMENLFGACGTYDQNGNWVQRYTGQINDPQWVQDELSWESAMQAAMHSLPHPLALIPNLDLGATLTPSDLTVMQILSHSDGAMDEGGFTNYGTGYLTDNAWLQKYQLSEELQAQNKMFFSVNSLSSLTRGNIQWALASYLMSKEHVSTLFIAKNGQYGVNAWHPEYSAQTGSPTDAMYQSQGVYWRDYSNGVSIVNSSSQATFTVNLNPAHQYVDLYGKQIGPAVTMSPHSGQVLLFKQ